MELYNEYYINSFGEDEYESCLNDISRLESLFKQYTEKYDSSSIEGIDILFKESLDHYVLKKLSEDSNFINTPEMKNYAKFVTRIYRKNNLEVNTNVVLKNQKYRDLLMSKFYQSHKQELEDSFNRNSEELNRIFEKLENKEVVTQQEIEFASEFVAKSRNKYLKANEVLLKYVFGKMIDTDLKFSFKVQDAVLSYLPFQYSNALVSKVRYVLCDQFKGKTKKGPAFSISEFVVFNKQFFSDVNLKSIEDSKVERLSTGSDITFFMIVAFHEITHNLQNIQSKSSIIEEDGLSSIIKNILNSELRDYSFNHDTDSIEIDANMRGWEECHGFYHEFYSGKDKEQLVKNCIVNKHTSKFRRLFAYKKDEDGNYFPYEEYDIRNLVKIIKEHPEHLNTYPMLKKFFTPGGKLNLDMLLNQDMYTENTCMEFIDYYFISGGVKAMSKSLDNEKYSDSDITHLINNMYYYIESRFKTKDKFDYIINHESAGQYRNNEEFSKEVAHKLSIFHYKKGLNAYKQALPLFMKIKKMYPNSAKHIDQSIEYLNRAISQKNVDDNEIDNIINQMAQGIDVLGETSNEINQSDNKTMGYAKIWILGIVTLFVSVGIIILGMMLVK